MATKPVKLKPVVDAWDERVEKAKQVEKTPFDYIVVGSGAGGGPLACRLALAGKRVLVIEAGGDPARDSVEGFSRGGAG